LIIGKVHFPLHIEKYMVVVGVCFAVK